MVCFNDDLFHMESDFFFDAGFQHDFKDPLAPRNGVVMIASVYFCIY